MVIFHCAGYRLKEIGSENLTECDLSLLADVYGQSSVQSLTRGALHEALATGTTAVMFGLLKYRYFRKCSVSLLHRKKTTKLCRSGAR